jgi:hypothetical protein
MPQTPVSKHLRVLREAGFVESRVEAQRRVYRIRPGPLMRLLEYTWGGNDLRWELEPLGSGTRLTLWPNIDRRFISWGAAGWHICFDILGAACRPRQRAPGPAPPAVEVVGAEEPATWAMLGPHTCGGCRLR